MSTKTNRAVRIAGASGSASDRRSALASFATNYPTDPVDVIFGDWMSEANMTSSAGRLQEGQGPGYERSFLEALRAAIRPLAAHRIKLVVNAGASDTRGLHQEVVRIVRSAHADLQVAWIEGDSVLSAVEAAQDRGAEFRNICTGERLQDWKFKAIYAHAYLGGMGIARALAEGADIVVCGRVSDASPVIGAAAWWHGWARSQLEELANAFVAGHLIECSTYVCGGNFTGFKRLKSETKGWHDIGFPIAEIQGNGDVLITKQRGTGGQVSIDTCTSQLLYEIQGPWYFNSDVTAVLDNIRFESVGPDRVAVRGVQAKPPPPSTKVGLTAPGGYQAELHYFLVGLDIMEKAAMLKAQILHLLKDNLKDFSLLDFSVVGRPSEDADEQNAATADLRILAQAPKREALKPAFFARPISDCIMQSYPGATFHLDLRTGFAKPIYEYYVTLLPQRDITHRVHTAPGRTLTVDAPRDDGVESVAYPAQQPSWGTTENPIPLDSLLGGTVRGPLGWLVHARSGDKGSNANVGFWVTREDEFAWLRTLLSVETIQKLLGKEHRGKKIDRFELPNLRAVHFLLHDHLDRGVSCTKTYDVLGKNVAEFLRSRYVDLPVKFLNRGRL